MKHLSCMYEISLLLKEGFWQGVRFSSTCFQNSIKKKSLDYTCEIKKKIALYFISFLDTHTGRWLAQPRLLIENVRESCLASCLCFMTQSPSEETEFETSWAAFLGLVSSQLSTVRGKQNSWFRRSNKVVCIWLHTCTAPKFEYSPVYHVRDQTNGST